LKLDVLIIVGMIEKCSEYNSVSIQNQNTVRNKEQIEEGNENLREYLFLALRIYERLSSDPMQFEKLKNLTRELDQLNNS
jgi:hypothetical protein